MQYAAIFHDTLLIVNKLSKRKTEHFSLRKAFFHWIKHVRNLLYNSSLSLRARLHLQRVYKECWAKESAAIYFHPNMYCCSACFDRRLPSFPSKLSQFQDTPTGHNKGRWLRAKSVAYDMFQDSEDILWPNKLSRNKRDTAKTDHDVHAATL